MGQKIDRIVLFYHFKSESKQLNVVFKNMILSQGWWFMVKTIIGSEKLSNLTFFDIYQSFKFHHSDIHDIWIAYTIMNIIPKYYFCSINVSALLQKKSYLSIIDWKVIVHLPFSHFFLLIFNDCRSGLTNLMFLKCTTYFQIIINNFSEW